jgi:DNA repair protein RecN (Recombination protein N)
VLNHLSVKNYALIDSVEIDFHNGLSIITGETGAGKSILMGALSLILGQRADNSALKNKEGKCVVEGTFSIGDNDLVDFFRENEIDFAKETILRREINQDGKSRAFINDTPVNLNILRDLGVKLVDIHSQHQNLDLNDSVFQLNIIDTYTGNNSLLDKYKKKYKEYILLKKQLEDLIAEAGKSKDDFEYFKFRYDELEKAKLVEGEKEILEDEYKTLSHAEEIQRNLATIFNFLSENQESVIFSLNESQKAANQISTYLPKFQELATRLESSFIEIKDIASEVELMANKIQYDPERAAFVSERLDLLNSLQQKHKANSLSDLIAIKDVLFRKINDIESFDEKLKEIKAGFDQEKQELESIANSLTSNRKNSFGSIEKYVMEQLKSLGIPNAVFQINHEYHQEFSPNGKDKINFLFSANRNGETQNIAKVASGGEISRLMLSIKSLISQTASLPTIVFDEIDTGVSGEIADKMGSIMLKMSDYMQVVNITHLPQVAAKGNFHYLVYKQDYTDKTATMIKKLNDEERLYEIAKMLSGENLSQQALENAKVLLNQ